MSNSYILTLRLKTNDIEDEILNKMFNITCHTKNIIIKHVIKSIRKLERDKSYLNLQEIYKKNKKFTKNEKDLRNSLIRKYGLTSFDLQSYALKQSSLYKGQLHSHIAQKCAKDISNAVDRYLFKNGKMIHFKKNKNHLSFENKNNNTGIVFKDNKVYLSYLKEKLEIPAFIRKNDLFAKKALNDKIKSCRIIRKYHKHKYRYYIQLCLEGTSPKDYKMGKGKVGIDIGPSTIAYVSDNKINIKELGSNVNSIESEIENLNIKLDKLRRINNPQNYNEDGTIKKDTKTFKKFWYKSNNQKLTEDKLKYLYQKRSEKLKYSHNVLAKEILKLGNEFIVEDMNYQALTKRSKRTEISEKTGRYKSKKRFGKSIANHAPSMLVTRLKTLVKYNNGKLRKVNCFKTAATQFDHISGEFIKHELNERFIELSNNDIIQRDLHSAFNLKYILQNKDEYSYDVENMFEDYDNFKNQHDTCINELIQMKNEGIKIPSSII